MVCISLLKSLYTETPIIDGNRKNIKMDRPLNRLLTPIGEFMTNAEPVVAVTESNIPAEAEEINTDNRAKIVR